MRILSARITRARHLRTDGAVEAMVTLLVLRDDGGEPYLTDLTAVVPDRAPEGASLRERILASAKLAHAAGRGHIRPRPRSARRVA
ncbi:hypothetical protein [Ostreiculturibacter nitratireducens]|uniref:hypothetical protein n=1 Tax=Ostreiculturibacter nitratireducens TaxID=3075226 RepID=UPI0031B5FD97